MLHGLSTEHIIQSNLIEGVKDLNEVPKSMTAWEYLSLVDTLTKQNILDVHLLVMDGLLKYHVGVYRPYNVEVGGRLCPHYLEVPRMMEQWFFTMRVNPHIPPDQMHIAFEHIHPFVDGNGRVGRLLMWWHEVKLNLPLTLITYEERSKYYDWF